MSTVQVQCVQTSRMCVKLEGGGAKEDDEGGKKVQVTTSQSLMDSGTSGREAASTAATNS